MFEKLNRNAYVLRSLTQYNRLIESILLQEKLSEEALSEKLASMKLRNAQLTAQREVRLRSLFQSHD